MWCMQRTNIYLDERQTEALDRLAVERGVSRAEVIRGFIDLGIYGQVGDVDADLAALAESAGVAPDFEFVERTADARDDYLDAVQAKQSAA